MLSFSQYCEVLNHQVEIVHLYTGGDYLRDDDEDGLDHNEIANRVREISNEVKIRFNWGKEITIAALVDGEVAGGVASEMWQDGKYWIYDFDTVVAKKWQGPLMIGLRLIDEAIKAAQHDEPPANIIRCYCVNPALLPTLIRLYGFTTYDRRKRIKTTNGVVFKYLSSPR